MIERFQRWNRPQPARRTEPFAAASADQNERRLIELRGQWAEVAATFSELGEALVLTRNDHALIVGQRHYPDLLFGDQKAWAVDANRSLWLDFSKWRRLLALREPQLFGPLFSLEVQNEAGQGLHRLCLTPHAEHRRLDSLLALHELGLPPFRPSSETLVAALAPWKPPLSRRLQWLRQQPPTVARRLPHNMPLALLEALEGAGLSLRTLLFGEAANQAEIGLVQNLEVEGSQISFSNASSALHLNAAGFAELWLACFACPCCGQHEWAVEAYDAAGDLILAWRPGQQDAEKEWRRIVERASRSNSQTGADQLS